MSVALRLYEQLTEAGEELEERYPNLKDVATQGQVRESELRLQKEIEKVRLEIKDVEGKLRKEIEMVRLEIKEVEGRLQKEIKEVEIRLSQAMHRQTLWIVGSVGTIIGLIRLLDWFLAHIPHPV